MLGFVRNHLDPSKMPGQAYDGRASDMSVKTNRAEATPLLFTPTALLTV